MTLEQLRIFVAVAEREHVVAPFPPPTRRLLSLRHRKNHVTKAAPTSIDMLQEQKT